MTDQTTGITFVECGIARALLQQSLNVPLNQRSYEWTDEEVEKLLSDVSRAYEKGDRIYFLGMIVLTHSAAQVEVADGQQRLATASILIGAIRDYLADLKDDAAATKYQQEYLLEYDPPSKDFRPKLKLNFTDHQFFLDTILKSPKDRKPYEGTHFQSHDRLSKAAELAAKEVRDLTATCRTDAEKSEKLYHIIEYLREHAKVIVITVPGDVGNAFKMFETLNARGLRASQVDILKNFIFQLARKRLDIVHPLWISMISTVESIGADDLLLTFIRHWMITQYGPMTKDEIGEKVENAIQSERQAIEMVTNLESSSKDYIAILAPRENPRWKEHGKDAKNALYAIIMDLGAEQIRPLLLSVARRFSTEEAAKAFVLCLSWSVRVLIVGSAGGGVLERQYGLRSREINTGEIRTTNRLAEKLAEVVPNDAVFRNAFAIATVRRSAFARYYLRAIELHVKGEKKPQLLPSEDTAAVSLEHILPVTPSSDWKIPSDVAAGYYRRLGNMALLGTQENSNLGNRPFREKKQVFASSPFVLTSKIANYRSWGPKEIEENQQELADQAVKVWPI